MGLFGKKKKPVMSEDEIRAQVTETQYNLSQFVRNSETKRKELLAKAKIAKARGDKTSLNMAINALRMIMQQQKIAEQMSLTMGIVMDTRDVQGMMNGFFSSMQNICTTMGQVPNFKEMQRAALQFNESMGKMNEQTMMMDEFLSTVSESMGSLEFEGVSTNDEIKQMIDRELANELDADDIAIQKELEEAKQKLAQ